MKTCKQDDFHRLSLFDKYNKKKEGDNVIFQI